MYYACDFLKIILPVNRFYLDLGPERHEPAHPGLQAMKPENEQLETWKSPISRSEISSSKTLHNFLWGGGLENQLSLKGVPAASHSSESKRPNPPNTIPTYRCSPRGFFFRYHGGYLWRFSWIKLQAKSLHDSVVHKTILWGNPIWRTFFQIGGNHQVVVKCYYIHLHFGLDVNGT